MVKFINDCMNVFWFVVTVAIGVMVYNNLTNLEMAVRDIAWLLTH